MQNELNFKISSALKNIIGRDLINDDFIAVFELVKNAYDAHASEVNIIFYLRSIWYIHFYKYRRKCYALSVL